MSPNNYEVAAVREALQVSIRTLTPEEIEQVADRIVTALHEQDLRLTSGGRTPSHDD